MRSSDLDADGAGMSIAGYNSVLSWMCRRVHRPRSPRPTVGRECRQMRSRCSCSRAQRTDQNQSTGLASRAAVEIPGERLFGPLE